MKPKTLFSIIALILYDNTGDSYTIELINDCEPFYALLKNGDYFYRDSANESCYDYDSALDCFNSLLYTQLPSEFKECIHGIDHITIHL